MKLLPPSAAAQQGVIKDKILKLKQKMNINRINFDRSCAP